MRCFSAPLLAAIAASAGAAGPQSDLVITSCRLPDGRTWTLGAKGVGRPFMAQLTLSNRGNEPIAIWDPENTEGMPCAAVVLTDANGERRELRPVAAPRAGGVATVTVLRPKQTITLELELLRLVGENSLPVGKYTLTPIYNNKIASKPPKPPVWTGRIEGEALDIEIVTP